MRAKDDWREGLFLNFLGEGATAETSRHEPCAFYIQHFIDKTPTAWQWDEAISLKTYER